MKYLSAYCMIALSGATPSEQSIKKVLESVGCEVDSSAITRVLERMKGKQLHEVIANGMSKLASVGPSSAGGSSGGAQGAKGQEVIQPKQEQKVQQEEEEEEEDVDMGDLFGDF